MKIRILLPSLALFVSSHPVQAAPMPAGYGVGRANEGAEQPAQVDYGAIVPLKRSAPQLASESTPLRVNNTYVVTTTADNVAGSLRTAINMANSNPGLDQITFAIGGGPVTLTPSSRLPDITGPVIIDGTTQPGYAGSPIVELAGTAAGPDAIGLVLLGGNSTVRGLVVNRWLTTGTGGFGIVLDALGANVIENCWLGIGLDGVTARPNAVNGLLIDGTSINNRIGGTTPAQRNVISGNASSGIQLTTENAGFNTIQGNWIGLNATGTGIVANGGNGIFLDSSDNTIGGKVPGARNVISGNAFPGIFIGRDSQRTIVVGNYIGTDPTGTLDLGNQQNGVYIDQSSNNQVGDGTFPGRNVIGGNEFAGVYVFGPATGNSVKGNFICTNFAGNVALGDGNGIVLDNVTNTTIGGTSPPTRNLISGTPTSGIAVINNATSNTILGNYIGTDSTGTVALATLKGILLNGVSNNTVGGTLPGEGNVISGNTQYGVETRGTTVGNKVYGNWIGTDPTGSSSVANQLDGIVLNSSNTEVKLNTIAFNLRAGVFDSTGNKNAIEGNSIFANGTFGIDNFPRNLTINDDLDADTGANDLQNFPVLDSIRSTPTQLMICGTLRSRPNRLYRLNFYDNVACGTAHFGEGRTFRMYGEVSTDANGYRSFVVVGPAPAVLPNYITATATDVVDGSTSEFSQCLCTKDADGDGIMDCWETQNWGMDVNSDGVRDLDLYALGARPDHKDIFVEVDAMNGFTPPFTTLPMVQAAFAAVPQDEVLNPDGVAGISLHAVLDETNITQQPLINTFQDLEQLKLQTFGTVAERNDPNHKWILAAKAMIYRYCMWVRTFTTDTLADTTSRGLAEYDADFGADDFVIGLGSTGPCGTAGQITNPQICAGAFMHELGHTLGLDHGGNDDGHQWKPNYYSVMNYMWAIPRPGWQAPGSWRLDYSHKPGRDPYFSILNEQVLVEEDGLVDQAGPVPILTMPYTDANYDVRQARVEFGVPVDWNGDGVIQTAYQELDINEPFFGLKDCNNVTDLHTSPDELLVPKSDWEDLKYNFRSSPRFHPPNAVVTTGDAYAALRTTAGEFIPEPDAAKDAAFDRLPAPRPTGKFTMNGVLDASAVPLASNGGITLYGVYKPPQLYLATNAAAAQGGDMVVLLSDSRGTLRAAPLGKAGQAGAWKASLFGRASGDPAAWADGTETLMNSISVDTSGTVLEGVVDVGLLFGKNPPNLYLALAKYASAPGGALLAQAPAGNGDGNVDGAEFLQLNGVVAVPETPVATAERVRVELLGAQPATHGARIRLTLGVAGDVDITLQNVAGRRIAHIAGGTYEAGVHDFTVSAQMAPGVYFLVTRALGETRATRVVIVR